eukprot:TRINITY_DN1928_c0_g1_i4.p1 TRINITY_DN1928_c0_g1~~TRINITY_DN1928_c0_g1_i4.p1  ORF type:complete len:384 (-),score=111.67 TRINITY_DN1928_c0_g1_i4:164-1315(-)
MTSTATPVSEELIAEWAKAVTPAKPYRFFQIKIKSDVLSIAHKSVGTASVSKDFDSMQALVADGAPCYFLFRVAGPTNWSLISYVPDSCKVNDRMVYAASKITLRNKLGQQWFNEELGLSSPDELQYSWYVKHNEPGNALSEFEQMRNRIQVEEEKERDTRSAEHKDKMSGGDKIGGYHHVQIPISDSSKSDISKFKDGSINFIEFAINPKSDAIVVEAAKSVPGDISKLVNDNEPRFYLHKSKIGVGSVSFIYCCPDKSPAHMRMVYSTAKPTLESQLKNLGIVIARKAEVREGSEIEDGLKREPAAAARAGLVSSGSPKFGAKPSAAVAGKGMKEGGGEVKAADINSHQVGEAQHPIYGLISDLKSNPNKKKVVLPPPGAW